MLKFKGGLHHAGRNVRDEVMSATKREQQPFVYGSLSKEAIYLKPSEATSTPAVAVLPATNAKPAALEQEVGKDRATPPDDNKRNMYTAEDAQRVEAFATELNLKMPPFSIGETKANVPASAARSVGIWSSKIGFGDGKGRCAMLIVTEVVSGTSDLALGFYLWGPPTKLSWEKNEQAGYVGFAGNITDGVLQFKSGAVPMEAKLNGPNKMTLQSRNPKSHQKEPSLNLHRCGSLVHHLNQQYRSASRVAAYCSQVRFWQTASIALAVGFDICHCAGFRTPA